MGPQRLILAAGVCLALGCGPAETTPAIAPATAPSKRHAQIVHAAKTAERQAVFDLWNTRNGGGWSASGAPGSDVDPIRLVVRKASRLEGMGAEREVDAAEARRVAAALLAKNVDLLGLGPDDVPLLDVEVLPPPTAKPLAGVARHVVRFTGKRAMRGYEGFDTIASELDIAVVVAKDGEARAIVNGSRIHPHLRLDTTPRLAPDDPKLLVNVVGRPLFALVDGRQGRQEAVRPLARVPLGAATPADVRHVTLHIHVSVGPMTAYVSYVLAYAVDVLRGDQPFRFIVDADTGDLLVDAKAPVLTAE